MLEHEIKQVSRGRRSEQVFFYCLVLLRVWNP